MTGWEKYFPFTKPRPQQSEFLDFAINNMKNPKTKFIIGELSTGVGKSAIAIALARFFEGEPFIKNDKRAAYIITTQKILQQQYKEDFPYIANISAKNNYICQNRKSGLTCDFGLTIAKISKNFAYQKTCCYIHEKEKFTDSQIGVTNLPFFLYHAKSSMKSEHPDIIPRKLLVIDEAHNLENIVIDAASLTFTRYFVVEVLKIAWPNVARMSITDFMKWVQEKYLFSIISMLESQKSRLQGMESESFLTSNSGISMMKKIDDLERQSTQIEDMIKEFDPNNWVMSVSATEDIVNIKPLFAKKYTEPLIFSFADKILLMSGTILDKKAYCNNVGIPEDEAEFISMDSPFDIKNRPVFVVPAGAMNRSNIKKTLPNVVSVIEQLMEHHKKEKGLIHTNSYEIAKYINDNMQSSRLLFHSSDDRMDILNLHKMSKDPTVLVSPSFTEGIDLVDNLSRFQIIVKCPFPYLGDNYIKVKMDRVKSWYEWQTIKTIIQASGRSVRSTDDYCCTYILDADMLWFYKKNKNMFPKWYRDSIIFS